MRLPDIQYGVGKVRPLGKMDDSAIKRQTQTEIDLSKARLGAQLIKADKIGQANIQMARVKNEVNKQSLQDIRDIEYSAWAHNKKQESQKQQAMISVASNLAQTAVSVYSSWDQAQSEANVATGITNYSSQLHGLATELSQSPTIDLNKYPDVDFSTIPENMIYKGTDSLTGKEINSAPNYLAAPLIFAAKEEAIRAAASENIDGDLYKAKFENGITQKRDAATAVVTKASYNYRKDFLSAQYTDALQQAIGQEDFPTSVDIINSAEATGVWSTVKSQAARKNLKGDIKFTGLVRQVDRAKTIEQLDAVRESARSLSQSDQISVRAVVSRKQSKLEQAIEKGEIIKKRTKLARNTERALDVGLAAGGGNFEQGRAAVVEWAEKMDPENLSHYTSAYRTRFNQNKNAEAVRIKNIVDEAAVNISKDPRSPIPAEAKGQNYINLKRLKEQKQTGTAPVTDMKRWNELYDQMTSSDPKVREKFANTALGPDMANLSESDFKYFKKAQSLMRDGKYTPTQAQAASAQFNSFAKQAFGSSYDKKDDVLSLRQAYINAVDQLEATKKGKSTSSERQDILNDLFSSQVKTYTEKLFGGLREDTDTLVKTDMAPYIPAISALLKQNGKPITADNIAKQYNFMLKNNLLEELDW